LPTKTYDLTILGGGPAGYAAALRGAQLGARSLLIEKSELGGTCLNVGCVPTKALLHCAEVYHSIKNAPHFGVEVGEPTLNLPRMLKRKEEVILQLRGGVSALLKERGVDVVKGEGRFISPGQVAVVTPQGEEIIEAGKVVLALGSEPVLPPVPGLLGSERVISSREALELAELPASLTVLGGGIIGLEFASLFHTLGVQVTIIEMLPNLAAGMDQEISLYYQEFLRQQGVGVYTGARVVSCTEDPTGLHLRVLKDGEEFSLTTPLLLVAAGRRPASQGLAEAGFALQDSALAVDDMLKTNIAGVYACGDLIGGRMLAHVAFVEGARAAEHALGAKSHPGAKAVPSCLYCKPEIGAVGLTEQEAAARGYRLKIARFPFSSNGKALAMGEGEGFIKIISEEKYHEILGVHIVGPKATELIAEAVLAIELEATAEELALTIHAHPTLSEGLMEAARIITGKPLHSV
jgi:dihydrolipoamide dehydrogenase